MRNLFQKFIRSQQGKVVDISVTALGGRATHAHAGAAA